MMYSRGYWGKAKFSIPIISVGNIQAGGTGKTPMVEYICSFLLRNHQVGVLSRGYKRKTFGFRLVGENDNFKEVGDEPLWLKQKHPQSTIGVVENRIIGVPYLVEQNMNLEAIILDDGFQQLGIKIDLNILLTPYAKPFTNDAMLPVGRLREPISATSRADIIVVTKCPTVRLNEVSQVVQELKLNIQPHQEVFLSSIIYASPYLLGYEGLVYPLSDLENILLITGIADASPLLEYVQSKVKSVKHIAFSDHYVYQLSDLKQIQKEFHSLMKEGKTRILTTEKDAIRLYFYRKELLQLQLEVYVQAVNIVLDNEERFIEKIEQILKDRNQYHSASNIEFEGY
ncbi:MAG: tetraacyldisaccharide 4'-kinase [Chitinophagales bacterium]|nr:tetraacyldisaccharide 4'-kinase [Chitinophagales bacterium]